eukprot:1823615-Rhodomonas_salina.1
MLFPPASGKFEFRLSASERALFYLGEDLILSVIRGPSVVYSHPIQLDADKAYTVTMQVKGDFLAPETFTLAYRNAAEEGGTFVALPSLTTFYRSNEISLSRAVIRILPSSFCTACTSAFGSGLSLAFAAKPATFTIVAKDEYCNALTDGGLEFVTHLKRTTGKSTSEQFQVLDLKDGTYAVLYSVQQTEGIYNLSVSGVDRGGLAATYYAS